MSKAGNKAMLSFRKRVSRRATYGSFTARPLANGILSARRYAVTTVRYHAKYLVYS